METSYPHSYPPIESVSGKIDDVITIHPPPKLKPQILASLIAATGGLVMGCCLGWAGPVLMIFNSTHEFNINPQDQSWIAALPFLGAIVGGPIGGVLIDKIGRKTTMLCNASNFAVSVAIVLASQNKWMLFIGRFLNGIACGIMTVSSPVYVSEVSVSHIRGVLGTFFQVMITIGILFINVCGVLGNWRWITVAAMAAVVVWGLLLLLIPESPIFYLKKSNMDSAKAALIRLRGHEYVDDELSELVREMEDADSRDCSVKDLFKHRNVIPLLITILIMCGQQFSGINAVISYSEIIFDTAHSKLDPVVQTAVVDLIMVVFTIVSAFVIDRAGRRFLLNLSSLVMAVSAGGLGVFFFLQKHDPAEASQITWVPLLCLSLFVVAFSLGFGPIPWLIMSEIFAQEIRGMASSLSASFNWGMGFLITLLFNTVQTAIGIDITFFGFAGIMIIVFILCYIVVPETKGKTLEEIQMLFRRNEDERREEVEDERNLMDDEPDIVFY